MSSDENNQIVSYLTQRRLLGFLGLLLPFSLFLFSQLDGCTPIRNTVSSYYFTNTREVFTGILAAMSIFLITYKGYGKLDNRITNIAGVLAVFIVLFPAMRDCDRPVVYLFAFLDSKTTDLVHTVSASSFFSILGFISFYLFTKHNGTVPTRKKIARNKLYRFCGITIFSSILIIGIYMALPDAVMNIFVPYRPIFFLESVALIAFGVSWLVKGEMFLKDN